MEDDQKIKMGDNQKIKMEDDQNNSKCMTTIQFKIEDRKKIKMKNKKFKLNTTK